MKTGEQTLTTAEVEEITAVAEKSNLERPTWLSKQLCRVLRSHEALRAQAAESRPALSGDEDVARPCWAVANENGPFPKTVHDSRRGAIVNWLCTDMCLVTTQLATDENIERQWERFNERCGVTVDKFVLVSPTALAQARLAEREAADKLRAHAKAMSDALLKVRPLGGSELFVRVGETFYADPKFCGDAIEKMQTDLHEARKAVVRARKETPND
jgi:hypothetical protein